MSLVLPPLQTGAAAWYGPEMAARGRMADAARRRGHPSRSSRRWSRWLRATPTSRRSPPPTFRCRRWVRSSSRVRDEVLSGRGFLLMRGLPVERWSLRDGGDRAISASARISAAPARRTPRATCSGHVRDLGLDRRIPMSASTRPTRARPFTPIPATSSALLCLKTAQSGGLSALVSSTTIFNEMRRRRPDLLALLFAPIATDRRGEVPAGQKPYFEIPVFNWHEGHLSAIYQRQYINSAQRFADAPRLTPAHRRGARPVRRAGRRSRSCNMTMEFKPGDMQFVHNHTILHDRTAFVDWPEPERGGICCGCGSPPPARGRCRRSLPSDTAR